jgi:hypothetical protein
MSQRIEELNERIYARNIPSGKPPMVFSPRPVQTKYSKQPIMDVHIASSVPIKPLGRPVEFLPADSAPFNGFMVDVESSLKNIDFALQNHPRAVYVPQSASSLYQIAPPASQPLKQPYPQLFAKVVSCASGVPSHLTPTRQVFHNVRLKNPS